LAALATHEFFGSNAVVAKAKEGAETRIEKTLIKAIARPDHNWCRPGLTGRLYRYVVV
jgi:hypothetical protein